jgi:hypothetical protein
MKKYYDASGNPYTFPESAKDAFENGQCWRPKVFQQGSRAGHPSDKFGVELWGKQLVLVEYSAAGFGDGAPCRTKKRSVLIRQVDPATVRDHFATEYMLIAGGD